MIKIPVLDEYESDKDGKEWIGSGGDDESAGTVGVHDQSLRVGSITNGDPRDTGEFFRLGSESFEPLSSESSSESDSESDAWSGESGKCLDQIRRGARVDSR